MLSSIKEIKTLNMIMFNEIMMNFNIKYLV